MAKTALYWTLPPGGDGRAGAGRRARGDDSDAGTARADVFGLYDHLLQIARAAKAAGFAGVHIPWDANSDDAWIVASALARQVRGLRFVPAFQPAFATPVYVAKMSASFQRLSGQRLAWALPLDGDSSVRRAHGDFLAGDAWFARADEFVTAARGVYQQSDFHFRGQHHEVEAGGLDGPLAGQQVPALFTIGDSRAAIEFAARQADVHLFSSPDARELAAQATRLAEAAAQTGRAVAAGLRATVLARPSDDEAKRDWQRVRSSEAAGAIGQSSDHAAVIVGSYDTVAASINQLARQGIGHFVLRGRPALEEAYRFAEHVAPRLASLPARPRAGISSPTPPGFSAGAAS